MGGEGELALAIGQELVKKQQVGPQLQGPGALFRGAIRWQSGGADAIDGGQLAGQGARAGERAPAAGAGRGGWSHS